MTAADAIRKREAARHPKPVTKPKAPKKTPVEVVEPVEVEPIEVADGDG